MRLLLVWPHKDSFGFKAINIALLSALARRMGWETKLFDTTSIDLGFEDTNHVGESIKVFKPVDMSGLNLVKQNVDMEDEFLLELKEYKPDCIALSVLSEQKEIAGRISKIAKDFDPSIPVIWGGKYPTLEPEEAFARFSVDFVCIGEGLESFPEFLSAIEDKGDLYNIKNIWAKKENQIIKNPLRPLKESLDDLPYVDWSIYDKRQFYKPFDGKVYIGGDHMTNWGCPYHCTYCVNDFYHNLYENKYYMRRYSVPRIIEELKYLKEKYKINFLRFHDEDFLMRPEQNMREFSEAYRKEVNLPFVIETNPKSVTEEKVKCLKAMNCVSVSLAVETGDLELRKKVLNRVDNEEDILKAFALLNEAKIRTVSYNMFTLPFETRETFMKTVDINRRAKAKYPGIVYFYPFEGTKLREIAVKEGFFDPDNKETSAYRPERPALHFKEMNQEEIIGMREMFVLYVKLPECFAPYIRRAETLDAVGVKIRKQLELIYEKTVWANDGEYIDDGHKDEYIALLENMVSEKMIDA